MSPKNLLILILFCLLFCVNTFAKPRIIWSSGDVTQQVLRGTTSRTEVSFVSTEPLSNVDITVVPQLARFLVVSPTRLNHIPANVSQKVTLTFFIPKGTRISTLDGTIQIRIGSVIPEPLKVILGIRAPTVTDIPLTVAVPTSDRIVTHPDSRGLRFVNDEIDVFFKAGTSESTVTSVVAQIGGSFLGSIKSRDFYQVQTASGDYETLSTLISVVRQNPNVELATHHYLYNNSRTPNDLGYTFSYGAPLIGLPAAWDITVGSKNIGIGIIDSLFDNENLDLRNNITKAAINTGPLSISHGTQVAGIVGAEGNNSDGIAGVMWNASLFLYSTSLPDDPEWLDSALTVESFNDTLSNGVRVINRSAGLWCERVTCNGPEVSALEETDAFFSHLIQSAKNENKDLLWIFSAGNGAGNRGPGVTVHRSSPARLSAFFDNVISVSSVGPDKQLASSSNYGQDVTVAAPGVAILSLAVGGSLTEDSGTSLAAPYVTGVAGLMLSVNPSLTASQIKLMIRDTADHTGNFDPDGNEVRLLNAAQAVASAHTPQTPPEFDQAVNLFDGIVDVGPEIATSGNNVYAAWTANTTGSFDIFFVHSNDRGATWSSPVNLSQTTSSWSRFPQLAVSGNSVYVVWGEGMDTAANRNVKIRCSTDGGVTFGPVHQLSDPNITYNDRPQIAASGPMVYVSWSTVTVTGNPIATLRRSTDFGTSFDPAQTLWLGAFPKLSAANMNVFVTGFLSVPNNPSGAIVFRRSIDTGLTFGPEVQLFTGPTGLAAPTVTGSNVYVVWQGPNVGSADVFLARSADAGVTFSSPVPLSTNKSNVTDPTVPIITSGSDVFIAWDQGSQIIFRRSLNEGATFDSPKTLSNTYLSGLGLVAKGNQVFAAWADGFFPTSLLFTESDNNGATFLDPLILAPAPFENRICMGDSYLYVAWKTFSAGQYHVLVRRRSL